MNDQIQSAIDCILLPGMHGTADLFTPLIHALQTSGTHQLDYLPLSYPPEIKQSYPSLLEWIESTVDFSTQKIIIAESFSTPLALSIAAKHPDQIRAIVISAGFCNTPVPPTLALLPLRPLFMMSPPRAAVSHFLLNADTPPEQLDQLRSTIDAIPSRTLSERVRAILTLEESHISAIPDTPTLLLQAQNDAIIPWENQNQLEGHLPHSIIHWIDSPHLIFQTNPDECAQHISQFLTTLD